MFSFVLLVDVDLLVRASLQIHRLVGPAALCLYKLQGLV